MVFKYITDFARLFKSEINANINEDEPVLVEGITKVLGGLRHNDGKLSVTTFSEFIHGATSTVKADFLIEKRRELGDMIFIVTLALNGKPEFERITINQCKKSEKRRGLSWKIAKEQLLLLAKFPPFKALGSFPGSGQHCSWKDFSGCLGSYGLFDMKNSEFLFFSATRIHQYLCLHKKLLGSTMHPDEYFKITAKNNLPGISKKCMNCNRWSLAGKYEELHTLCENGIDLCVGRHGCPNQHFAKDIDDFSHKYLTLQIGEPTIVNGRIFNPELEAVAKNLKALVMKTQDAPSQPPKKEKKNRKDEPEDDGGGLGIIYTRIDMHDDDRREDANLRKGR